MQHGAADKFKYSRWILGHRFLVTLTGLAFIVISAAGTQHAVVDGDYDVFFDDDNKYLAAYRDLENTYTKSDGSWFAITNPDGDIFSREHLKAIKWLADQCWYIPYFKRVEAIVNFPYTRATQDELITSDLFGDIDSLTDAELEARRQYALNEPELVGFTISEDGSTTGIVAQYLLPGKSPSEVREVAAYSKRLVSQFRQKFPDLKIYYSGSSQVAAAFSHAATAGLGLLLLGMYVVVLALTALFLRSLGAALAMFIITITSVAAALGIATWIGLPITPVSANAPVIIVTLAVANMIHILAIWLTEMRRGRERTEALKNSLALNLEPILLTSVTTAIGFAVLNTSVVPPYRYLGTTTAIGVVVAFVLSYTLLPVLLSLLPIRARPRSDNIDKGWERFANFMIRFRTALSALVVILAVILISFIGRNTVDDRIATYFKEGTLTREAADFISNNLTGWYFLQFSIPAETSGGVVEPSYLRHLKAFETWCESQPGVQSFNSVLGVMRRLNKVMNGDEEDYYRIPESRKLAAQYLLLYELSLPFGRDLTNVIDIDKSASLVQVRFRDISSNEMRAFEIKAHEWMQKNWPKQMQTRGTGTVLMFAYIWGDATRSNLRGMIIAVILIAFVIGLAMRSWKLGLLSLVPNVLPAAMAFGVWGLLIGQIDVGSSIVAVISFGIIVDDTIHFLSKYRRARKELGESSAGAVRYAFRTVGRALLGTAIILVAGFMVLAQSDFTMNSSMGVLTGITIAFSILLCFVLLPALLCFLDERLGITIPRGAPPARSPVAD